MPMETPRLPRVKHPLLRAKELVVPQMRSS